MRALGSNYLIAILISLAVAGAASLLHLILHLNLSLGPRIDFAVFSLVFAAAMVSALYGATLLRRFESHRRDLIARSRQLEAREEETKTNARFRKMAEIAPVGIFTTDANGNCHYVNKEWSTISGLPPEGALGDGWRKAVYPDDRELVLKAWAQSIHETKAMSLEFRILKPDKSVGWVFVASGPVEPDDGQETEYVGYVVDLTARKGLEIENSKLLEQERLLRQEAERLSQLKDQFMAMLSHELRTPIGVIVGWSELLKENALDTEEQEAAIEVIARNAKAEANIVDDLLDLSRIMSGKLQMRKATLNLGSLIDQSLQALSIAVNAKQIEIEKRAEKGTCMVYGDPNRLHQVVWNLINNAVKFTPSKGRVLLEIRRESTHVLLRITDTGIGMTQEQMNQVFQPFWQAEAGTTRSYGGLGLGLAIVKRLIDLHGGAIQVSSPGLGKGTTFEVSFPVAATLSDFEGDKQKQSEATLPRSILQGQRVLVVEDETDARRFIQKALELYGAEVVAASTAAEALRVYGSEPVSAVVSDLGLPATDGFELIRRAQEIDRAKGENPRPAIALTAYASPDDSRRAKQSGFDFFLAKPVEPLNLVSVVAQALNHAKTPEHA